MSWRDPELLRVPVEGGALTAGRWGAGRHLVVASHGITANHRSFGQVAAALADADVTLVAVDHRGRGRSAHVPGPYGLDAHTRDLLATVDHLAAEGAPAVLLGHSMGAYIAALAAERAPDRVAGLVLVDGALPLAVDLPPDTDIEEVVRAVIGPALERLDLTFDTPERYLERWRAHPAVGGPYWNDVTEAYVRYDLVPVDGGGWRSPVVKDAVLEDGGGPLADERARTAIARVRQPTTLLWAPRGLLDQTPGLLPPDVVADVTADLPHVTATEVADVNHYSIVFSEHGARAVAAAVERHTRRG